MDMEEEGRNSKSSVETASKINQEIRDHVEGELEIQLCGCVAERKAADEKGQR